jgi:hypothetical protein
MKQYTIEITETLQKLVYVEANSAEEAILKVKNQYLQANIVLDDTNIVDTQFEFL